MPAPDPVRALQALRTELAAQRAASLADACTPLAALRELQERLKLLDAAIDEQRAHAERALGSRLLPLLVVGAALLLAATVPVGSVPVSLSIKVSAVSLDLPNDTVLGPIVVDGELRVEGFSTLESADALLVQLATREHADRLVVRAGEARLGALRLPAGARLTASAQPGAINLDIESAHSPVTAELELRGPTQLRLGDAPPATLRDDAHGEWLHLQAGDAAHAERAPPPMALSLPLPRLGAAPWRLQGLRPARLRFIERRDGTAGLPTMASSIESGTLLLPATGQTVALVAGDVLEIDGLVAERFSLVAGAPLLLELNGSARGLRVRTGEFERSLKPSWLEYLARHHLAQLLWGSAAVLWGALAWTRKQFSGAFS